MFYIYKIKEDGKNFIWVKTLVTWCSLNGDCDDENFDEDDEGVVDDKKLIWKSG